jgi:uncharacterized membrane protein (UPF0127 family)
MRKDMLLLALTLALLTSGCTSGSIQPGNSVCIMEKCFSVEIADTPDERMQGLMGRAGLDEGAGMLFIFDEEGNHSFWMKDMKFAIDIVWIGQDMEVVYVSSYTQPCEPDEPCPSITPPGKARYVLETSAGEAYGFEAGVTVKFSGAF